MAVGLLLFSCKLQFDMHARSVMAVNNRTLTNSNTQIIFHHFNNGTLTNSNTQNYFINQL